MQWPTIYRYKEKWFHGGIDAWDNPTHIGLIKEILWLSKNGKWSAGWEWPKLIFGFGRLYYDGPHWHLNIGILSISLSES